MFGQLASLEEIWIDNNNLTGPLPSELGELTLLEKLWIQDNFFTGTVPTEFGQLSMMTYFVIKNNNLTGSINETFCGPDRSWTEFQSDCLPDMDGNVEVVCDCCNVCCYPDGSNCQ